MPIKTYGPWPKLNLSEIINESPINFDKSSASHFQTSMRQEVLDLTHPEIIDDAVNNKIDFNKLAKETLIDLDNLNVSLIKAFDVRVSYEQDILKRNDGRSILEK